MHGCVLLRTDPPVHLLPLVRSHRSLLSLPLSVPDAFVPRCREAAALVAVRYARLADEKNKRKRKAERQKEQVDDGGRVERKKERSSERERRGGGNIGRERKKERERKGR